MTRALIDRIECDKCGGMFYFEKFNNATMTARMEHLTDWLRGLGWVVQESGLRTCDICPTCDAKDRQRFRGNKPRKDREKCPDQ